MCLETTYGSTSFFILATFSSTLPYIFQATLFSTHPSRCHKPLTHPVNNPKRSQIFRLSIQTGCHLSIWESTLELPLQQIFRLYYTCSIQKLLYTSKPPKSQQEPSCPTHYAERSSNIRFTGWIRQRFANTISVSWPPRLNREMLSSRSGIQPEQLNMNILILMFLWPFLPAVLVNVFLWPFLTTQVV